MKSWHIENLARIKLVESVLRKNEGEVKLKMSKVAISSTDFAYFASDAPDKTPSSPFPDIPRWRICPRIATLSGSKWVPAPSSAPMSDTRSTA